MEIVRTERGSRSIVTARSSDGFRKTRWHPWMEPLEARLVLSTFKVNTLLDTVAVNLKTGKDASGHISLRSAIQAANSRPNSDTILLPRGTITLTLAGANEDNAASGDLDVFGTFTM
jgi:fibronectin-binding autotransporter adhesin